MSVFCVISTTVEAAERINVFLEFIFFFYAQIDLSNKRLKYNRYGNIRATATLCFETFRQVFAY